VNIFITGATGFIGNHFLVKLLARLRVEDRVFLLVRRKGVIHDQRVQELMGSLEDVARFRDEILSSDYVFHLAANPVFGRSGTVILGFKNRVMLVLFKFLSRKLNVALWGMLFEKHR
jgi:nucleoside-diphosphate-sugar epimerase